MKDVEVSGFLTLILSKNMLATLLAQSPEGKRNLCSFSLRRWGTISLEWDGEASPASGIYVATSQGLGRRKGSHQETWFLWPSNLCKVQVLVLTNPGERAGEGLSPFYRWGN